jgi:hypothetical protein
LVLFAVLLAARAPGADEAVKPPNDTAAAQKIAAAADCLRPEDWQAGTLILQRLLDAPDDPVVTLPRGGKENSPRYTTAQTEARRLLEAMPPRGRDYYATTYGPQAEALRKEAHDRRDVELLGRVVRRFPVAPAALATLDEAARLEAEADHHLAAAVGFDELRQKRRPAA